MSEEHREDRDDASSSIGMMLLGGLTILLAIALAVLWTFVYLVANVSETSTLEDVERTPWVTPLFWLGIVVLCLPWIIIWRKKDWRHANIPAGIALAALLLSAFFSARVMFDDRTLTFTTWVCEPRDTPFSFSGAGNFDGCEEMPIDITVAIGTSNDRDRYPGEAGDGASYAVSGLPQGYYSAWMTITAPIDTADIVVLREYQYSSRSVGGFKVDNPFAGEARMWSAFPQIDSGQHEYALLFFVSPQPALEDAAITFEMQDCDGTPAAFDPDQCTPRELTADQDPILAENTPRTGPQGFREPVQTVEGNVVTWTNLEARTYAVSPFMGHKPPTQTSSSAGRATTGRSFPLRFPRNRAPSPTLSLSFRPHLPPSP